MPLVHVHMLEGRTPEQKEACGAAITAAMAEHCGARQEKTYVVFHDVPLEDFIVGDISMARHEKAKAEAAGQPPAD